MKKTYLLAALMLILMTSCGPAALDVQAPDTPTPQAGALVVDPGMDLGPISPYIYGSNYGPWTAVPVNMLPAALDSKVTVIRWPGGAWGDSNDIQPYQLDAFMAFCKQMNAIPTISVRLLNGTPEAAAGLVRYANIEKGYAIQYWSIGNEPNLFDSLPFVDYDVARFNQEWRAIAKAMKAVDPQIQLLGPELSQWGTELARTPKFPVTQTPTGLERQDWMTEFLKSNGDLVDIVSVHRYPMYAPSSPTPITVDDLRQNTLEWEPMASYLRDLIKTNTGRDLPIAFTEVNSDPSPVIGGAASPDSFYNAIWYADVLGRMINANVFMVNHFLLSNASMISSGFGLITISGLRPTYYVFQMYHHFGTERVYAASGVEYVSVYAAKRVDGSLTILVINLTDAEQRLPLQVQGKKLSKAQVWLFDASHNAEDLGEQPFKADVVLDLPAQSVSLYVIGK